MSEGKTIRTRLGVLDTVPVRMSRLRRGERFVGPDGVTVYQVTRSRREHPRGWLVVRNLSMTDTEARAAIRRGDPEPGADPRGGFFAYSHDLVVDLVTGTGTGTGRGGGRR